MLDLEADAIRFEAPAVITLAPTVAHGFRFRPEVTEGFVISFTEDVAGALGESGGAALARLRSIASNPLVSLKRREDIVGSAAVPRPFEELRGARRVRGSARALHGIVGIEVARLAASRNRSGSVT